MTRQVDMSREVEWNEVAIDVGWGVLRGKRCITGGSSSTLRLLCLHGLIDNANTFDRLVPFLPNGLEILVLDLPGHGFSDHFPKGAHYGCMAYVITVRAVVLKLEWKSFLFMTHSMGSVIGLYYTAIFPADVKAFINFDFLIYNPETDKVGTWRSEIDLILEDERKKKIFSVCSEEEAIERLVKTRMYGQKNFVNVDAESAKVLLPRSIKAVNGGFIWTNDYKAKLRFKMIYAHSNWLYIVKQIKCPMIFFQPTNGILKCFDAEANVILNTFRENIKDFKYVIVEGTHHVHLTHPKRVAPALVEFLLKFVDDEVLQSKL